MVNCLPLLSFIFLNKKFNSSKFIIVHSFKELIISVKLCLCLSNSSENTYNQAKTVICREFSKEYQDGDTPYYPIDTPYNRELYAKYLNLAKNTPNLILGGRLGMYKYMDMDKTIRAALDTFENIKSKLI